MTAEPFTKKTDANGSDREALSTFTGARLDWLKCVAFDRALLPNDFKVAFVIAMHLNLRSGSAMLSDATIADKSAAGARHVRRARARLHSAGWLTWHGTSTANVYRPNYARMNATLDAMLLAREARREKRQAEADRPNRRRPWQAEGISRSTWYRRLRQKRATGVRVRQSHRTYRSADTGSTEPPYTLPNTLKEGESSEEESLKGGRERRRHTRRLLANRHATQKATTQ